MCAWYSYHSERSWVLYQAHSGIPQFRCEKRMFWTAYISTAPKLFQPIQSLFPYSESSLWLPQTLWMSASMTKMHFWINLCHSSPSKNSVSALWAREYSDTHDNTRESQRNNYHNFLVSGSSDLIQITDSTVSSLSHQDNTMVDNSG